jgi:hypothetical protein
MLRFYTTEQLAPNSKRAYTPEGFLLCSDVPIARCGTLLYGRGEIPVQPNKDGIIRIQRDPDTVFHPNAILSFAGKPITDDHPPTKVTPDNWKSHSIGTVLNPHQGEAGQDPMVLYADLLVQDRQAIDDVLAGKIEVSAGYDAEYEQLEPGVGKQHNVIGNHVALVTHGRCGPICSIGDSAMALRATNNNARLTVDARRRQATRDRIMQAFLTGDEETLVDELDKVDDMMGKTSEGERINVGDDAGGMHIHVHNSGPATADEPNAPPVTPAAAAPPNQPGGGATDPGAGDGVTLESLAARIDQLEQAVAILAQGDDGDDGEEGEPDDNQPGQSNAPGPGDRATVGDRRRAPTGDTAANAPAMLQYQEMLSRAEILVPGLKQPTLDSRRTLPQVIEGMSAVRRDVLTKALAAGGDAADAVKALTGNARDPSKVLKAMTNDAIAVVFNGASEMIRTAGVRGGGGNSAPPSGRSYGGGTANVLSLADTISNINKVNKERYGITK